MAECLKQLAVKNYRTDGHFILELLVKPSEVDLMPSDCSILFQADPPAVQGILDLGLAGGICLRLAVKFAQRFRFAAPPVCPQELLSGHFERARLAGLVEYLAFCKSLELPTSPRRNSEHPCDSKSCPEKSKDKYEMSKDILQKLTAPPAEAAVLDLVCQHCPHLCQEVSSMSHGHFLVFLKAFFVMFMCDGSLAGDCTGTRLGAIADRNPWQLHVLMV